MSWKMLLVSCTSTLLPMQVVGAEVKFDKQGCYAVQHHLIQHTDGYVSGSFDVLNIFDYLQKMRPPPDLSKFDNTRVI